jgi:hypothetical protein
MHTCYMCLEPATSSEHVPPRCLFPESKDVPTGKDYRKNLLTVPSCDEHNSVKSKDDQFLLLVLLIHFKNNEVGQNHFASKLIRTLERRSSLLGVLSNEQDVLINGSESSGFRIDRDRFDVAMERITRALHFAEYREKWNERIIINTPSLFDVVSHNSFEVNLKQQGLKLMIDKYLSTHSIKGANPEVFHYQIDKEPEEKKLLVKMVFYEGFVVYAYSSPEIANWRRSSNT